MSETRYTVSVRTDAADGLETVLAKSSRVLISLHAPAPFGPAGFEVTSIERQPRDGQPGPVQVWDASAESAARAETRAALRERAESYSRDARGFADMNSTDVRAERYVSGEDCKRYAAMYRTIADELRKVAASL